MAIMIAPGFVFALLAAGAAAEVTAEHIEYAQLTIRQRVIIRVPTRPAPAEIKWKERRAPRCVPMKDIAGAAVLTTDSVDILFRGGLRIRAMLESACPALDYYSGFYVAPTADTRICAGRDAIHARSGGECQIKRFIKLVPVR